MTNPNVPTLIKAGNHTEAFHSALEELLFNGRGAESRNGGVVELPNVTVHVQNAWPPNIASEYRKASLPTQMAETAWILSGRNDVKWLSKYLPRAIEFSDDGETWRGGYGPRLRQWPVSDEHGNHAGYFDQIEYVVDLLNKDPETRRAVIAIYDPAIDSQYGLDIPCNNLLRFDITENRLNLTVSIRSNDIWWGWSGINSFEWPVLQALVAQLTGTKIGSITYNIANLHIYDRHREKATRAVKERVEASHRGIQWVAYPNSPGRDDLWSPKELFGGYSTIEDLEDDLALFFNMEEKFPEEVFLSESPEPKAGFFRLALEVLWADHHREFDGALPAAYQRAPLVYWANEQQYGQHIFRSYQNSPRMKSKSLQSGVDMEEQKGTPVTSNVYGGSKDLFIEEVTELHRVKSEGYGDSWRRRGEMLGILANEARKIDRLMMGSDQDHETLEDTAVDLFVYLVKHRIWIITKDLEPKNILSDGFNVPIPQKLSLRPELAKEASDSPDVIGKFLHEEIRHQLTAVLRQDDEWEQKRIQLLNDQFNRLQKMVEQEDLTRVQVIDNMIQLAGNLALNRWSKRRRAELDKKRETLRFDGYATTEEEN